MKMWLTPIDKMCTKHLMMEHEALHEVVRKIALNISVQAEYDRGDIDPYYLIARHVQQVTALKRRGFKHDSFIHYDTKRKIRSNWRARNYNLNVALNQKQLHSSCHACLTYAEEKRGWK